MSVPPDLFSAQSLPWQQKMNQPIPHHVINQPTNQSVSQSKALLVNLKPGNNLTHWASHRIANIRLHGLTLGHLVFHIMLMVSILMAIHYSYCGYVKNRQTKTNKQRTCMSTQVSFGTLLQVSFGSGLQTTSGTNSTST